MTVTFDGLPIEVKRAICRYIPQSDFLNARLASSELCTLATEFAFQSATLLANKEATENFVSISKSSVLRKHVRHVTLDTRLEDNDYTANEEFEFPEDFIRALSKLGRFERLSSLLLWFSSVCVTEGNESTKYTLDKPETEHFRFNVLKRVARGLNNPKSPIKNLKSLSIHNLQNRNDPISSRGSQFLSLLPRLEALRLHIIRQEDITAPETNIEDPALYDFLEELPSVWLQPASSSLTTLSLYQDDVLALGHFTFAHQDHLNWILGHGNTLKKLYLDDCSILYAAKVYRPMDSDGFPSKEVMTHPRDISPPVQWTYDKRWSFYLAEFETGLPKLKVFSMGHGDWPMWRESEDKEKPFITYEDMKSRELECDYIYFDIELEPSQWMKYKYDEPLLLACENTDHEALEELWKTVDARMRAGT